VPGRSQDLAQGVSSVGHWAAARDRAVFLKLPRCEAGAWDLTAHGVCRIDDPGRGPWLKGPLAPRGAPPIRSPTAQTQGTPRKARGRLLSPGGAPARARAPPGQRKPTGPGMRRGPSGHLACGLAKLLPLPRTGYLASYSRLKESPGVRRGPRLDAPGVLHHVMVRGLGHDRPLGPREGRQPGPAHWGADPAAHDPLSAERCRRRQYLTAAGQSHLPKSPHASHPIPPPIAITSFPPPRCHLGWRPRAGGLAPSGAGARSEGRLQN